jgi:hypothetical protein
LGSTSVEHFPDPLIELKKIRLNLAKNGLIFIQVPNLEENAFDLLIADHGSFFTEKTISYLLRKAGFKIIHLSEKWISKELSVLAIKSETLENDYKFVKSEELLSKHYSYLSNIKKDILVKTKRSRNRQVVIFGSSIGATWAANEAGSLNVACFLDEDMSRVGSTHLNIPIKYPSGLMGENTIVPLVKSSKEAVIKRYCHVSEIK